MSNVVFDEILGKVRAGDVNSGGGGGGGSDLIAGNGLTIAGGTASVAPGYRMNTSGGTVNQDRFFPIETVSGTSVTLQAGHAYIINATTIAGITLNCESFAANTFGLEGHATIYTANAGYVQQGANVYISDPLEPDAVNNCTIRFHGGSATVSVEDYFGGYIVLSGGTGSGSLPYGLASAGSQYIGFNASLNGQTLDLSGAVANGEKHIVGNGYNKTILTGAVDCGSSSFTVANLSLQNVVVNGGVMTLGDAFIPPGSTVAVGVNGNIVFEKVVGSGTLQYNGKYSAQSSVVYISGITLSNFNGNSRNGWGGFSVIGNTKCELVGVTFSGNVSENPGVVYVRGGGTYTKTANFSSCTFVDNKQNLTDATPTNNTAISVNSMAIAQIADCSFDSLSRIMLTHSTAKVELYGSNTILRDITDSGSVTLTSGAILDLTGNSNPTPIAPGGGITFESGGATVQLGSSAGTVDSSYMMDNVTLPAGAKLTNTAVIDLGGTNVVLSGGNICNASGCTFVSGYGAVSGGGAFFNSNTLSAHIQLTDCAISGCSATMAGAVFVAAASATLTNCDVIGNRADGLGGGIMIGTGKAFLSNCIITDNFASNTETTPSDNDLQFNANGSAVLLGGNTVGYAQMANGGTVLMSGTNKVTGVFQYRGATNSGTVTLTSGATLDLTGNENPTPIAPGGGITFEQGGATVKVGASTASSSYMMDNVILPAGAKLTNTAVVDLGGTNINISSGGTAYASGATFSGGSNSSGGAFYVVSATADFVSCTFTSNTASRGADVFLNNASASFSGCSITSQLWLRYGSVTVYGGFVKNVNYQNDGLLTIEGAEPVSIGSIGSNGSGNVIISSGAAITLTSSIAPNGTIEVVGGTCTINNKTVNATPEGSAYQTIVNSGGTLYIDGEPVA